jgi:hypothetical protein
MGYELDRIMAQYGVATPSAVYGGMAPVAPVAPVYSEPQASGSLSLNSLGRLGGASAGAPVVATPSYEQQVDAYNALLAKYNEDMPRYLAEKARAEQAAALHQAAIESGGMYNQSQFGYEGGNPDLIRVGDIPKPDFTPLAPLAYMGSSLGTNAAGGRTSLDTGGMGGEGGGSGGSSGEGPTGVSTTGGFGTMGALGTLGQVALGTVANALSSPNTQAQQDAISVVDMGPTSMGASAMGGTTGPGSASGIGVGSTEGINGMDAASDAASAAAAADAAAAGVAAADAVGAEGIGGTGSVGADSSSSSSSSDGSAGAATSGDAGWARGGAVRRKFATGGLNDLTDKYELSADEAALPTPAVSADPLMAQKPAPAPVTGAQAPAAGAPAGMPAGLEQMLARYQGGSEGSMYGTELKAARTAASAESEKFAKMIEGAMTQGGESAPSKAEMYFRLAAAFGAPTRTGSFGESLGAAGRAMGEYSKETREAEKASRNSKLQLALKGQELRMSGAKEDLNTLRTLAGEEMKDKRAVATKLLEQYIKSGEPESAAGKQAKDEGLRPGTPEYQTRVKKIAESNVEAQMSKVNATLANMSVAQANLALAQQKFGFQQDQASKLTGPELKLKTDTEDMIAQTDQALVNLKKAYSLNPNTFDASLVDVAQRKVLEAAGSKDPKVQNTREMENMLEKAALSSLKSTFPGAISNDERKALQDVQGLGAKSKEERAKIMKNGYAALKSISERSRKRLLEINSGVYRNTGGEIEEGAQ